MLIHTTRLATLSVLMLMLACTTTLPAKSQLPTDHAYQQVLRNYLGTLTEADFAMAIEPIGHDRAWFEDEQTLFKHWMLHQKMPAAVTTGIIRDPRHFTLEAIESPDGIRMRVGRSQWISAEAAAWWTQFDYPGNPYFDSKPLKLRAFVAVAVDMMMLDQLHEAGRANRADWLGGTLQWLAYTFMVVRDDLPEPVQQAYAEGLRKMAERLMGWGPNRVNDNIDVQSAVGLWYSAEALRDPAFTDQVRQYIARVIPSLFDPSGVIHDAGGLDSSYGGIALYFLTWAALASDMDELKELHGRVSRMKSYLTLPDPDGNWWSPSHFNSRTSAGAANDQWPDLYRDLAAAMLSPEAEYLVWRGRRRTDRQRLVGANMMHGTIGNHIGRINNTLRPNADAPDVWIERHWTHSINFAFDHYRPGTYQRWLDMAAADDPATREPFAREGHWIKPFPDDPDSDRPWTFVIGKPGDYGFILYTGPLGWHSFMNYGGGAMSAFWTPQTGTVLLGRSGEHSQGRWPTWRIWPTHALSGVTEGGEPFSSARIRRRVLEIDGAIDGLDAQVQVQGAIGREIDGGRAGKIDGQLDYHRKFRADEKALHITTQARYSGSDTITELYEILPVFIRDERLQKENAITRIQFIVDGRAVEPTDQPTDNVQAIELSRFEGIVMIAFDQPQRVRLAPQPWLDDYETRTHARNIMIDLMPAQGSFRQGQVGYSISAGQKDPTRHLEALLLD